MTIFRWSVVAAICLAVPATAQQQQPGGNQPAGNPPVASNEWEKLPRLQLEQVFAGPLRDTIIQRWRDPTENMVCYLYMPITAQHSQPMASGFVQYGANLIGSISCVQATAPGPSASAKQPARPTPKANPAPAPAPK